MFREKFRIQIIKPGNPFLPSPDELSEFLGLPTSPRERLKWFEATFKTGHLPSVRTLDNIGKAGVRWATMRHFVWSLAKDLVRKGLRLKVDVPHEKVHFADLAYWWSAPLLGLQKGLNTSSAPLDLTTLTRFIRERCDAYQPQFAFILNAPPPQEAEQADWLRGYYSPVIDLTLLTVEEKSLVEHWLSNIQNSDVTKETELALLLFFNDFWLSFVAVIDNIIMKDWEENLSEPAFDGSKYPSGLFGLFLSREEKTFLGKFFAVLSEQTKHSEEHLASYVPLPASEYKKNGENKIDVQKDRFRKWRNGRDLPSVQILSRFFQNMGSGIQSTDLTVYAILLRALDKANSDGRMSAVFTLEIYKRYFSHFKQKAAR